jgi:hypothetical protein
MMDTKHDQTPLQLLPQQRSHVLLVQSEPERNSDESFLKWFQGAYRNAVVGVPRVLRVRHYKKHSFDITASKYPRLPFHYLGVYELSLDGAEEADDLLRTIETLHREEPTAGDPAMWLYYPACEKVGRSPTTTVPMLTLAFANGLPGREEEFREWYATRHIRHALKIPALVSGQVIERTQFQHAGSMEAKFSTVALYEQTGTPESILECFRTLPKDTLKFPAMDWSRFAEWVYEPLSELAAPSRE